MTLTEKDGESRKHVEDCAANLPQNALIKKTCNIILSLFLIWPIMNLRQKKCFFIHIYEAPLPSADCNFHNLIISNLM